MYFLTYLILKGFVFIRTCYSEHVMIQPEGPSRLFYKWGNRVSEIGGGAAVAMVDAGVGVCI